MQLNPIFCLFSFFILWVIEFEPLAFENLTISDTAPSSADEPSLAEQDPESAIIEKKPLKKQKQLKRCHFGRNCYSVCSHTFLSLYFYSNSDYISLTVFAVTTYFQHSDCRGKNGKGLCFGLLFGGTFGKCDCTKCVSKFFCKSYFYNIQLVILILP